MAGSSRTRLFRALRLSSATTARPSASNARPFRLAVQIVQPPGGRAGGTVPVGRKVVDAGNCGRLVAEQVEPAIGADFEVAEIVAGFGQRFVGKPGGECDEFVAAVLDRPACAGSQRPPRARPRGRAPRGPNSISAAGFFSLAISRWPPARSTAPSPREPSGSDQDRARSLLPSTIS